MVFYKENPCNRDAFELAVSLLSYEFRDRKFSIANVYLDYGADMRWDTILCDRGGTWGSYQLLNPRDWEKLNKSEVAEEVLDVVRSLVERINTKGT